MQGRLLALAGSLVLLVAGLPAAAHAAPSLLAEPQFQQLCGAPSSGDQMSCFALVRTDSVSGLAQAPRGYGPSELRSAYNLPSEWAGNGATVAIVDAYDHPNAESDLAVYRQQFGLPPCTTANGCFKKVNEFGMDFPLPAGNTGWGAEISLDLDMVSAICPNCHILLLEANAPLAFDLFTAVNTAVGMGAKYISNSYGGSESLIQTLEDELFFNHPGVAITASSGDTGYGVSYPAASKYVTAVGGTSLNRASNSRGWSETAWSGAGSGCSAWTAKASWQDVYTNCSNRAIADVAAVADPKTGVAVYDSYGFNGWHVFGGTSVGSPIVAAIYALAGTPGARQYPASYPYANPSNLFNITSGSNGTCGNVLCEAGPGWNGPTGLGTPNGTAAFAAA